MSRARFELKQWGRPSARTPLWTSAELGRLRELAGSGVPLPNIASELGRTAPAIRNKAAMHGISLMRSKVGK